MQAQLPTQSGAQCDLIVLYISTIIRANFLRNLHEGPKAGSRDRKIGSESPLPDSVRPQSPHN